MPDTLRPKLTEDIVLRHVPHYGWLPIIVVEGEEKGRGSFHPTPEEALASGVDMLERVRRQRD